MAMPAINTIGSRSVIHISISLRAAQQCRLDFFDGESPTARRVRHLDFPYRALLVPEDHSPQGLARLLFGRAVGKVWQFLAATWTFDFHVRSPASSVALRSFAFS